MIFNSFIEKFGTHIVVGLSIGGQDVVLVKQDNSSTLEPSELKKHLQDLGDQLFTGTCNFSPLRSKSKDHKQKVIPYTDMCILFCLLIFQCVRYL